MSKDKREKKKYTVAVEFNQQQEVILQRLRKTGKYGKDYGEIIAAAFQEFLDQTRF